VRIHEYIRAIRNFGTDINAENHRDKHHKKGCVGEKRPQP
jgi:hypothetical protein